MNPPTLSPDLAALIRRNTVAGGFANTVAIAEEAFEMGVKSAAPPAVEGVKDLWQNLLDKDDRTSPEEYPDHALITFDEFTDYVARAKPSPTLHPSDREEGVARALFAALKKCCIGWDKKSYVFGSHEVCEVDGEIHLMSVARALPAILALSGSLAPANPTEKGE